MGRRRNAFGNLLARLLASVPPIPRQVLIGMPKLLEDGDESLAFVRVHNGPARFVRAGLPKQPLKPPLDAKHRLPPACASTAERPSSPAGRAAEPTTPKGK